MVLALLVLGFFFIAWGLLAFLKATYLMIEIILIKLVYKENTIQKKFDKAISKTEEYKSFESELEEILDLD